MKRTKHPDRKRTPTSIDVAKRAGVSRSTVGFVLNNTPGQTISPSTRQKVLKASRALGYHPDAAARTLRKGMSNEIAMFSTSPAMEASAEWTAGVQARACELGYHLAVYFADGLTEQSWRGMLDEVLSKHPAGVIAWAPLFKPRERRLLHEQIRALVFTAPKPVANTLTCSINVEQAARIAGTHLAERGHRHIALPRPPSFPIWESDILDHYQRGLEAVLAPRGGTINQMILPPTFELVERLVQDTWRATQRPTAVLATKAEYTLVLLKAFSEHGLRVPEDVAIVCAENSHVCQLVRPALTSISSSYREGGYRIVDVVDALIHGRKPDSEMLVLPPPQLIIRESS